jgi:hypothetical protein
MRKLLKIDFLTVNFNFFEFTEKLLRIEEKYSKKVFFNLINLPKLKPIKIPFITYRMLNPQKQTSNNGESVATILLNFNSCLNSVVH